MVQRKEYVGFPFAEILRVRYDGVDFTVPFLSDRYRLFTKSSYRFRNTWMTDLFSRGIWYSVMILYAVSTILFIVMHSVFSGHSSSARIRNLISNYSFYYFYALCGQGDELYRILEDKKIMAFSIGMFSRFLLFSYSSYVYVFMARTERVKPIKDLETLFHDTDYMILVTENAGPHNLLKISDEPIIRRVVEASRYKFFESYDAMWDATCSDDDENAAFQYFYDSKIGNTLCEIEVIGKSYYDAISGVLLSKNSEYKKPMDYGIMKLREFGIIEYMESKWFHHMKYAEEKKKSVQFSAISLDIVLLPIFVFISGILFSSYILILEWHWKLNEHR